MTRKRYPGRPVVGREKRARYLVTLEPAVAEQARVIGDGNLSGGVATAISAYRRRLSEGAAVPAAKPRRST